MNLRFDNDSVRVWLVGGLGSQLDSLCAGICVASNTDRRLVIDYSIVRSTANPKRGPSLTSLDLDAACAIEAVQANLDSSICALLSRVRRRSLALASQHGLASDYAEGYRGLAQRAPGRTRYVAGNMGPWSIRLEALASGLRTPFRLNERVTSEGNWRNDVDVRGLTAVHVRLDDFRSYGYGAFMIGKEYYRGALEHLGSINSPIAVFSDEPKEASALLESAGADSSAIISWSSPDPAFDLVQLSRFPRIVCSNSSFSLWGALSSNGAQVVLPEGLGRPYQDWTSLPWTPP